MNTLAEHTDACRLNGFFFFLEVLLDTCLGCLKAGRISALTSRHESRRSLGEAHRKRADQKVKMGGGAS